MLFHPRLTCFCELIISGKDKRETQKFAQDLGRILADLHASAPQFTKNLEILGPIEAPLSKIADNFRWQILIKGLAAGPLHAFVNQLIHENAPRFNNRKVKVVVDVDPCLML